MPRTEKSQREDNAGNDDLLIPPKAAIAIVNLIPLAGAIFFGWQLGFVALFYAVEISLTGLFASIRVWETKRYTNSVEALNTGVAGYVISFLGRLIGSVTVLVQYGVATVIFGVFAARALAGEQQGEATLNESIFNIAWLATVMASPAFVAGVLGLLIHEVTKFKRDDTHLDKDFSEYSQQHFLPVFGLVIIALAGFEIWEAIETVIPVLMGMVIGKTLLDIWRQGRW